MGKGANVRGIKMLFTRIINRPETGASSFVHLKCATKCDDGVNIWGASEFRTARVSSI